jgi:hypothetical protein
MAYCDSIQITKAAREMGGRPEFEKTVGIGDERLTLFRLPNGSYVIETNGDPIFEDENQEAFAEALSTFKK